MLILLVSVSFFFLCGGEGGGGRWRCAGLFFFFASLRSKFALGEVLQIERSEERQKGQRSVTSPTPPLTTLNLQQKPSR